MFLNDAYSRDIAEASEWIAAIEEAKRALEALAEKPINEDFIAPLWKPDKEAGQCNLCNSDFNMISVRRHHCR